MNAEQVVSINSEHPDWSSKEIAIALNTSWGYVRRTLLRRHICTPSTFARRQIVPGLSEARPKP